MSKISEKECSVIKDLLPVYCDNLVSETTKAFVETHLGKCEKCRSEYEKMAVELPKTFKEKSSKSIFDSMMKKKKTERIVKSVISVVIICTVVIGGFFAQRNLPVVAESEEEIKWCHIYRTDTEYGKRFYIYHYLNTYESSSISMSTEISEDGKTLNLILKKPLICSKGKLSGWAFGPIVNESDNFSDAYSYFSENDIDYSNVTTVKLNDKVIWTEEKNGNDTVPDFIYEGYKGGYGSLSANEYGVTMELPNKTVKSWDWDGKLLYENKTESESE